MNFVTPIIIGLLLGFVLKWLGLSQWLWVILAFVPLELSYFLLLPKLAERLVRQGRRDQAVRLLAVIANTPALLGGKALKVPARYQLMILLSSAFRYEGAVAQGRALLRTNLPTEKPGMAGVKSDVHRRLADCLDALGRTSEAEEERYQARGALENMPVDAAALAARGLLLEQENRWSEAFDIYQRAYALTPAAKKAIRAEFATRACLAAFNTGNSAETARWAEAALSENPREPFLSAAHKMAGVSYGDMGRLTEAESHIRFALDAALAAKNLAEELKTGGMLANLLRKQGRVSEAIALCRAAEARQPDRDVLIVRFECHRLLGEWEKAGDALRLASETNPIFVPQMEQRSQALYKLGRAWLESERDNPSAGWDALQQAIPPLESDAKLSLWCEAAAAILLAQLGQNDAACGKADFLERMTPRFEKDASTARLLCASQARLWMILGEFARSKIFLERYLSLSPDPVLVPRNRLFLGDCERALGNLDAARNHWQEAVSLGFETWDTERARKRLAETVF